MKRKRLVLALVLMCVGFLVFASGSSEAKKPEIVVNEDYIGNLNAETVITVAMYKDNSVASTYPERREWALKTQTAWANANPQYGVEILYVDASQIAVEMSKFLTEAELGVAPDVIHLDSFFVGTFLDAGVLQPLNEFIPQDDLDPFFDWTKEITVRDGKQYALWGETDARLLFYRKDLIPTPPRTWDELIEIATQVSRETGMHGFLTPSGMSEAASNEGTWPYFWGQGGEIFGENSRPVLGEGENRQKLIDVYSFQKRLIDSGAAPIDIASMTGFDPILAEVAANNVAMFIHGTWAVSQVAEIVEDSSVWDYTFLPMAEADQFSNTCGGWTWAVLTDNIEKKKAAVSFLMDVIGSKEAMAARCIAHGQIPVRTDVFEHEYFKNDPDMVRFLEQFEIGHSRPASSLYPAISDLNAKMLGKVLIGELTPTQAVDQLQQDALKEWEEWKK
ncbi:MAG: extracellular solute-binding protein [Sphaerochaetaceae bacterium]|nr:extracellular solute-binding protein [Sphaerochaetaceae bacterium]